jgi:hypothetical protein
VPNASLAHHTIQFCNSPQVHGPCLAPDLISNVRPSQEVEAALAAQLAELYGAAAREREALAAAAGALAVEREAFEAERCRVREVLADSEQVVLNVGGVRFTTTVTTLRNAPAPSLFSAMFSGRHALQRDPADGSIFIDR